MKEPTTFRHKSSRRTSTPPPITPHHWENMTIDLTLPPPPAEITTPAETCVLLLSYFPMVMGNTVSLELFCKLLPHAPPMHFWHLKRIGALLDHFARLLTPTMEEMSMSYKSQLMIFQMVFLPGECLQLCSYTDVNYLNLDVCKTRDILSL